MDNIAAALTSLLHSKMQYKMCTCTLAFCHAEVIDYILDVTSRAASL